MSFIHTICDIIKITIHNIHDVMFTSCGCHMLFSLWYVLTELTAVYTCVCHTSPYWKSIYSLYRVMLQILNVSVTLHL